MSDNRRGINAGRKLLEAYKSWKSSLSLTDFLYFLRLIQVDLKEDIMVSLSGMAQIIGQFRAYSFEEYVRDLVICRLKRFNGDFRVLWNEKLPIWKSSSNKVYNACFDIMVVEGLGSDFKPLIVIEAKVDVDAPRLKTALFNFSLLRRLFPSVRVALVYINWNADQLLLSLADEFSDATFNFKFEWEVERFLDFIELNLQIIKY